MWPRYSDCGSPVMLYTDTFDLFLLFTNLIWFPIYTYTHSLCPSKPECILYSIHNTLIAVCSLVLICNAIVFITALIVYILRVYSMIVADIGNCFETTRGSQGNGESCTFCFLASGTNWFTQRDVCSRTLPQQAIVSFPSPPFCFFCSFPLFLFSTSSNSQGPQVIVFLFPNSKT